MFSLLIVWLCFSVSARAGTSRFVLDLQWKKGAPDGVTREMVYINGQFPGPTLIIQQGDSVEITVNNHLPANTTIHGHGIDQIGSPWSDGVPGVSQRNIKPGESFTYRWTATQYGSYFYHAHSRGMIDDGCYGPIIIKPKSSITKPFSKIPGADVKALQQAEDNVSPLVVSDWRHVTSDQTWQYSLDSGFESALCQDTILLNGKGYIDCWSKADLTKYTNPAWAPILQQMNLTITAKGCLPAELLATLNDGAPANVSVLPDTLFNKCTPSKGSRTVINAPKNKQWIALDIISAASIDSFAFSIDEHPVWIYAVDGRYIEPLKVDAIPLLNGDRYSVFVQLNKPAKNYAIRIASTAPPQLIDALHILSYESGPHPSSTDATTVTSKPSINRDGTPASSNVTFFDTYKSIPFPNEYPSSAPKIDQTIIMASKTIGNSYTWALDNAPFDHATDLLYPPLLMTSPTSNRTSALTTISTKNGTWVDLIFTVAPIPEPQPPHPMHKHSNKAFILGQGTGAWTWKTVEEAAAANPGSFNLVNPPYRDAFLTPPAATDASWLAVRYQVVNPGAFLLHCHIQSHLNGGMAVVMLDGVDEWPQVPKQYVFP